MSYFTMRHWLYLKACDDTVAAPPVCLSPFPCEDGDYAELRDELTCWGVIDDGGDIDQDVRDLLSAISGPDDCLHGAIWFHDKSFTSTLDLPAEAATWGIEDPEVSVTPRVPFILARHRESHRLISVVSTAECLQVGYMPLSSRVHVDYARALQLLLNPAEVWLPDEMSKLVIPAEAVDVLSQPDHDVASVDAAQLGIFPTTWRRLLDVVAKTPQVTAQIFAENYHPDNRADTRVPGGVLFLDGGTSMVTYPDTHVDRNVVVYQRADITGYKDLCRALLGGVHVPAKA